MTDISMALTTSDDGDGVAWKRPHPYTLIVELFTSIRDLIFPIVFLATRSGDLTEIFPIIAVVLPLGAAAARYYSTRYALTSEALLHEYGVIKKNKQVLPRRNIQNLSTSAGLVARATGLVEVTASDASQGGDVKLRLLSEEDANQLLTLLRSTSGNRPISQVGSGDLASGPPDMGDLDSETYPADYAPPSAAPFESAPLHSTAMGDLIKYSFVTSAGPLIGLSLLVVGLVSLVMAPELRAEATVGRALIAVGTLASILVPALGPITALGGFRLWADPDRLRIKTGLLTEIQINARRERLQMVRVNHHLFARRLGLESIQFETADVDTANLTSVKHLAPAVSFGSWPHFATEALGEVELAESDLQRVSPLTRRRSLVRWSFGGVFPLGLFAAAALVPNINRTVAVVVAACALSAYIALALWHSKRRAERLGYAIGTDQFMFRNGVVAEKLLLIRKEKVQTLRVEQSFFQRRLGLASLVVGTAGLGSIGIGRLPDLETDVAHALLDHLSAVSAATPLVRTL